MSRTARLGLVAALLLAPTVALAPAAHAAGSITSPGGGAEFETETAVRLEARVEGRSGATELRLVDPTGTARTVASAGTSLSAQTLAHVFDTACPEYPGSSCSGRRPARNGTWTVQLTGGATDSRSFVLRVPPRAPAEVRAEAVSPREVVVTWQRGAEPDLRGYEVVDGEGRALVPGDTACPSGTCRTVVAYDADGPRTEVLAVRAVRATCPDCDGSVTTTSSPVSAQRPGPAPSAPADGGSSGGGQAGGDTGGGTGNAGTGAGDGGTGSTGTGGTGTGGTGGDGSGSAGTGSSAPASTGDGAGGTGTGGTGSGGAGAGTGGAGSGGAGSGPGGTPGGTGAGATPGSTSGPAAPGIPVTTTQEDADAFALSFRAFGPKIGLPKLPPLPASGVALPAVAPPPADGGFAEELPFGTTTVEERVPSFVAAPAQRIGTAVSAAVDSERLMRSLAAALVLLLVCAHVRRWLAQAPSE